MQLSLKVALLSLLAQDAFALPGSDKNADKKCKVDLVLLAFANPLVKAKASSFCSTFIGTTVTTTATSTQINIASTTTTLPAVTNTMVIDDTTTLPQPTSLTTLSTTIVQTLTTLTTVPVPGVTLTQTITVESRLPTVYNKKRNAPPKIPAFAAAFLSTQISSACSCIVTPVASTVTVSEVATSISTAVFSVVPTVQVTMEVTYTVNPGATTVVMTDLATATNVEISTITADPVTLIIPTTTIVTLPAATAASRCNVRGGFYYSFPPFFTFTDQTNAVMPEECYLKCQADPTCQTYFYDANSRRGCTLASRGFQEGFVKENDDTRFGFYFNNRNCPNPL